MVDDPMTYDEAAEALTEWARMWVDGHDPDRFAVEVLNVIAYRSLQERIEELECNLDNCKASVRDIDERVAGERDNARAIADQLAAALIPMQAPGAGYAAIRDKALWAYSTRDWKVRR